MALSYPTVDIVPPTRRQKSSDKYPINLRLTYQRHQRYFNMKEAGVTKEFIGEGMGHTDLKSTESYLDSLEDGEKRQFANALL